jgi:hypothetical protein
MRRAVWRGITLLAAAAFAAWLAFGASAPAEEKTLSWDDELCRNTLHFDPEKHDEMQLTNTLRLLFTPSDFTAPSAALPADPQSIAALDVDKYNEECGETLELASGLQFIPLEGIEEYRRAKIAEIADWCEFESARLRGYTNPAALHDYRRAAACAPFVDALEGRDMLAFFRKALDQNCSSKASPAACTAKHVALSQRADGMDWVKLYLTGSGWNDCAARFTLLNTGSEKLERMRAGLEDQLLRMFRVTRERCEPPS